MNTNTNANSFAINNIKAGNKSLTIVFNPDVEKASTFIVDDFGKHSGSGTPVRSWQMKKFFSALTAAMNDTYKVVEGDWLFLKATEEYIKTQLTGFEAGYCVGGASMVKAIEEGRIVRDSEVVVGHVYKLTWNGHVVIARKIEVLPYAEDEKTWVGHARNQYHHVMAISMLAKASMNKINVRLVYVERLEEDAQKVIDLIPTFESGDGEAIAKARYERKNANQRTNELKNAEDLAKRITAKTDGFPEYLLSGINVFNGVTLEDAGIAQLIGNSYEIKYITGRPYLSDEVYKFDESNAVVLASLVKKHNLVLHKLA